MNDVLITVPTRGQIQWQTVSALEAARDYMGEGTPPILYQEGNLSVAQTRNRIVKRFLQTDCQLLAMVDDDVAPPINFVELMLPHMAEFAMVGLPHSAPHPSDPGSLLLTAYDCDTDTDLLKPTGLWSGINQVDAVATGCVLVTRHALEKLGPAPFRIAHDPDADLVSDDFLFCADLREAGFRIGTYWDGHPVDHFSTINLTPLTERQLAK